jgi:hypothetical protein
MTLRLYEQFFRWFLVVSCRFSRDAGPMVVCFAANMKDRVNDQHDD